ncbi:primosomal protein N' [Alicyclobacillus ferrooxydans]|uniref:Replication restart protein PriA n=1 Tax=Alicyclobacillus ferrooxydans TaxID=471514 RepID=A0A0P9EPD5_9BACL|nr:primosomal protein N' [Alicyclobacillus ferrooxydans]KPV45344.1 hypothetical protein AN477_03060 [Alicyclobacillus ferrooxydans]
MTDRTIAKVVVDVRTKALSRPFDYVVPDELLAEARRGHRVLVSFGRQVCQGYVVDIIRETDEAERKLKPILTLLDEEPILSDELLALCEWMTERYICTFLEAVQTVLPGAFRTVTKQMYRQTSAATRALVSAGGGMAVLDANTVSPELHRLVGALDGRSLSAEQLVARLGQSALLYLPQAKALGLVEDVVVERDRTSDKFETLVTSCLSKDELRAATSERRKRAPKQAEILEHLLGLSEEKDAVALSELGHRPSSPTVAALVRDNLVQLVQRQVFRDEQWLMQVTQIGERDTSRTLTQWQRQALQLIVAKVHRRKFEKVVVHGVTGSGKTEVYMQAIHACIDLGLAAIVLVPEISLTPQMVQRFTMRFGFTVAVLHSGLSMGERKDAWARIQQGTAKVVIGARSAVFAPVQNLGLIVVDEEHEPSYKQDETPFYDAREVAERRSAFYGATVVYGSATPSLAAMAQVEAGEAALAMLPSRINGGPMPVVEVVDMREELKAGNRSLFSVAMTERLEACVENGHQAILFLNRRGYSAFLLCRNCGERLSCPNCDISLTLHRGRSGEWLKCHYCGYTAEAPSTCPTCNEPAMRPFGIGTQQVEEHLHHLWPSWRVLRMDVDTTRRKGAHHELITRFERGEAEILLGTQMVAKGLDFPNVAFVGVISADTMLAVPDYRANERTFNLLTQVAGRAGRAEVSGTTVIQTYRPDHYAILAAAHHDYGSFYRREKETREAFAYPPYRELSLFLATHQEAKLAEGAARRFEREVRRNLGSDDAVVLPASPSAIGRIENRFRFQVVVKYSQWSSVKSALHAAYTLVADKMHELGGTCVLDVNAGRM